MRTITENELIELRTTIRTLSHDVRSPLTSILGLAELTLEDSSLSEDARENLTMLVSDAERLTDMMIKTIDEIETRFFAGEENEK